MRLIDAVEHPLVSHVGMVEVRDWAVVHRGEDVVALIGRADGLEFCSVLLAVARRAEQCGECAARARAIRDDLVRIAGRQAVTVVAQVAHGRLVCTDIARALAGSGCAVVGAVTCVRTPEDEGGKLALAPAGYAIFRDGDYVGSIEPETARGASMLLGVAGHGDLAVTDSDGSTVMLTLGTCKTRFRPVWSSDGALARVDVTLKLRASIAELRVPRRITAQAYQDELNAALAALVTGWAEDVIAVSQALGADFLGVGQALAIGGGRRWAAIRDDWPAVWQAVPVRVTVSADVGRTFDLRDGIDTSGGGT